MLRLEKASFRIENKSIVNQVSCHFEKGKLTALLGYNGSGKTSLFRLCLGMMPVSSGKILWNKELKKGEIAYMPQQISMLHRSVYENILYVANVFARDFPDYDMSYVDFLLDKLLLNDICNNHFLKLSGGEKKRLSLACSLLGNPRILFLDEPSANLDPYNANVIDEVITWQKQLGCTIILITHHLYQVRRLADNIFFMQNGMIIEQGTNSDILQENSNSKTKSYFNRL